MKTIFITGASSGLGKATAKLFAERGWNVIATMRSPSAEKDLILLPGVKLVSLDVTDASQIKDTVRGILETTSIDVVFNNAGYGLGGSLEGVTEEQMQQQIDTNLLGVIRITKAFIPHFRERKMGVFIATTSIGGHVTFPLFSLYHATKWALEGWSESLSFELAQFGIQVKTIAPGGIKTDFAGRSLVLSEHPAYKKMVDGALVAWKNPKQQKEYSTAEQIAAVVYKAATDGTSQLRYIAGKDAKKLYRLRRLLGYKFFMKQVRKIFFK